MRAGDHRRARACSRNDLAVRRGQIARIAHAPRAKFDVREPMIREKELQVHSLSGRHAQVRVQVPTTALLPESLRGLKLEGSVLRHHAINLRGQNSGHIKVNTLSEPFASK
jgi:hypothetical protein